MRTIPRSIYFLIPSLLTEAAIFMVMLASPIHAIHRFNADAAQLGLMGALAWAGYALVALAAGTLSDRTGRRPWIIAGLASQAILVPLLIVLSGMKGFLALIVLQTALLGFFWAPMQSFLSETTTNDRLPRELAAFNMSWAGGNILGAILFAWLDAHFGVARVFIVAGVLAGAALIVIAPFQPRRFEAPACTIPPPAPLSGRYRYMAWILLACNFLVINMLIYIFPRIAVEGPFFLNEGDMAHLHLLRTLVMLISFGLIGAASRWHFRVWPFHASFGLLALLLFLLLTVHNPGLLWIPFMLVGIVGGVAYSMSAFYSMLSPKRKGAMMGTHEMLLSGGNMLGPLLAGGVIHFTGRPFSGYLAMMIPILLAWAIIFTLQSRRI